MTKKLFVLLLILLFVFTAAGCTKKTPGASGEMGGPEGAPTQNDITEAAELWAQLDGVYCLIADNGYRYFVRFYTENDALCYMTGALSSDYFFSGTVSDFRCLGGTAYEFTVNVPAQPASEMNSGWDAYSFMVSLDLSRFQEGAVILNNTAADSAVLQYDFNAKTLDEVTM